MTPQTLASLAILTVLACHHEATAPSSATVVAQTPSFREVTIDNSQPRRDVQGEILDAHDGNLQFFGNRYYLYGTAYGKTAGYGINNRFRVYSTPDLQGWTFEGELLDAPPDGVYYRPYVVYNPNTRKYVLWYNWYPKLWDGKVGVAVSETPVGPFRLVDTDVNLSQAADRPGDGSPFVDDDGTAYIIYTVIGQGHAIRIERLTRDFLHSTGASSPVLGAGSEAPAMFRRGGRYYAVFDSTCCFCRAGSGARVFVASKPLGPYTETGNINRTAGGQPIVAAQQTYVAGIPTRDGLTYVWMGDRWGSRPDGIKGHDPQFWAPLQFLPDGTLAPIDSVSRWHASVRLGIRADSHRRPYLWPTKKDPNPLQVDPCTGAQLPPEG